VASPVITSPAIVTPRFDDGPAKARIGLLTFETDIVLERDFEMMLPPGGEIAFYTARLANADEVTADNLVALTAGLGDAARRVGRGSRLDVVAFGCTSATILVGIDEITRRVQAGRPGVTVVTPISAVLKAMRRLGMARTALLTPYGHELHNTLVQYLREQGVIVSASATYDLLTDEAMGRVSPAALLEDAARLDLREADGIFISCTSLRAAEIAEALEARVGRPVVTSTQAFVWDAFRSAGYAKPISGFGRLLTV